MARKPGTPNKHTLLKRENLLSAIEVCRSMAISPPQLLAEAIGVIRTIALSPLRPTPTKTQEQLLAALTEPQKDAIVRRLREASQVAYWLMEYSYPKLARIETVGDAPTLIENKITVTLNTNERGLFGERAEPEIAVVDESPPGHGGNGGPRSTH